MKLKDLCENIYYNQLSIGDCLDGIDLGDDWKITKIDGNEIWVRSPSFGKGLIFKDELHDYKLRKEVV